MQVLFQDKLLGTSVPPTQVVPITPDREKSGASSGLKKKKPLMASKIELYCISSNLKGSSIVRCSLFMLMKED